MVLGLLEPEVAVVVGSSVGRAALPLRYTVGKRRMLESTSGLRSALPSS